MIVEARNNGSKSAMGVKYENEVYEPLVNDKMIEANKRLIMCSWSEWPISDVSVNFSTNMVRNLPSFS